MTARPDSRAGAWISLFAMLMMFIGPLIAQAMPMAHSLEQAMPRHAGMAMDTPDTHCQQQASHGKDTPLHPLWERCGYCSLFFHCPALPHTLQFKADSAPPATARLLVQARQGHGVKPVFPGALTRAPPFLPHA
jgi:hypothetical protein